MRLEELARVRAERLYVAPLAFGVERIEDERRLPDPDTPVTTVSSPVGIESREVS
jgi:hypothetical protein